jgi:tetratricopeptide (TPR) repeat protein
MNRHTAGLFLLVLLVPFQVFANEEADFKLHFDNGHRYSQELRWDEAIREYSSAVEIKPNHAEAHFNLSLSYYYKYRQVIDANIKRELYTFFSNPKESKAGLEHKVISGEDPISKELHNKAFQEWQKTVELDDSFWEAHYFLGSTYCNNGDYEKAEKEFKKTILLKPDYANSYSYLGTLYKKTNRTDLAIKYHEEAIAIDPDREHDHYELWLLYKQAGIDSKAKQEYDFLKSKNSIFIKQSQD